MAGKNKLRILAFSGQFKARLKPTGRHVGQKPAPSRGLGGGDNLAKVNGEVPANPLTKVEFPKI